MTIRTCTSVVAFVLLLSPAAVQAAPATIRVFEGQVHAAPDVWRISRWVHDLSLDCPAVQVEPDVRGVRRTGL
jgi:hypothetical protein